MALRNPPSWLQNGSHPAENDRLTMQAIFATTGIIGSSSLAVTQNSPAGMSVLIDSGWAAIVGTTTTNMGVYTAYNDAQVTATITTADPTNPRIDRVCLTVSDAYYSGALNQIAVNVVAGTPAVSPSAPATPANSISLATIAVGAGVTSILTANITDTRVDITTNLPVGDITAVTAGTGLTGGGSSGSVTLNVDTAVVATLTGTQTLSNKTLTAPKFATAGEIDDENGAELIKFPATVASAVNEITITNAATGDGATTGRPTISATGDDTNIALNLVPKGTGTVQANGVPVVTTTGTQTLTNKTLTTPVISSISNSGTLTLPTSTDTLVGRATTDTLTNKTLTSPTINGSFTNSVNEIITRGLEEDVNVVASAATGTINYDVATASVWYYTSNATANHTLNFRYNSGTSLSSKLAVGDAITLVWLNTNGTTAYYPNVIQIDGSAVTPKVPAAISAGNASAIDAYVFTIIKTAATPTYTVLETQTKFA